MKKRFTAALLAFCLLFSVSGFAQTASAKSYCVPVYRFYSYSLFDYLYTASESEKEQLISDYNSSKQTYAYDGIAGYVYTEKSRNTEPVYRFWNNETADHFYTSSKAEKDQLISDYQTGKDDYVYEGIAWYAPATSGYSVYRFFDTYRFNHYYTDSYDEYLKLYSEYYNGCGNYRYEGIAFMWM